MFFANGTTQLTPLDFAILRDFAPKELQRFLAGQFTVSENSALPPIFHPVCLPLLMHPHAGPKGIKERYHKLLRLSSYCRINCEYHLILITKSDGSIRTVYSVGKELSEYQQWINRNILAQLPVHPCATAYKPGSSVKQNAAPHVGHRSLVQLDLENFFDHVTYKKVKKVFLDVGYTEAVSKTLAMLCTRDGTLPQGASSSPALANLVFYALDEQISALCRKQGITYTRYCDDLCFSADCLDAASLLRTVRKLLLAEGFPVNSRKTRVLHSGDKHQITGVVSNVRMQAPSEYRKKLRQEMYYLRRYGLAGHLAHTGDPRYFRNGIVNEEFYLNSILGRINYVLFLNPEDKEFQEYREEINHYCRLRKEQRNEYKG